MRAGRPPRQRGLLRLAAASAPGPAVSGTRAAPPSTPCSGSAGATADAVWEELGVAPELLPRHVALIMDGNRRWAAARGLPAAAGHAAGVESLRCAVRACHRWGIPVLTAYAFSAENWARPPAEVSALLALMERTLRGEAAELAAQGVRLCFLGQLHRLPASLRAAIQDAERATADNDRLHLAVAISYSGRQDMVQAVQALVGEAAAGRLRPEDVSPHAISQQLSTRHLPAAWREPDLLVRTSGERRLSNFLCWEAAYAELYFSEALWPDFKEPQLAAALRDYAGRERRFGAAARPAA